MLEWDILNYLKKWRTNLRATARIMPLNGAPKLGSPGDFSAKEFKYQVTAADGTKREWTIKITDFVK